MYEEFYGLSKRPFPSVPQVDAYYPGGAIDAARQTLVRCVERAEGVGMVIGPSGTGKTLLCMTLAEHFRESLEVACLPSARLRARRALLQAILYELGRPYRGMDEGELRLALVDYLTRGDDCPRAMLLVVDEAHTLPFRLLDEIHTITNLVRDGQPRTRLVLAGNALLEERFASPKLESFSQRIVARCYLESFHRDETQAYIHAQFTAAGRSSRELISDDACHAVYQATDGVPRLINQLCDHALLLAWAAGRKHVDRAVIEEAWADLQQLPTPWNGDGDDERPEKGIIEFGDLNESDQPETQPGDTEATDDEPSFPMLRISAESDSEDGDPVRQVERIEQAISELDADFQPAGSIRPELELVFDEPHDPFGEKFAEEEMVVDRLEDQPLAAEDRSPQPRTAHEPDRRRAGMRHTHSASVPTEAEQANARSAAQAADGAPVDVEPDDPEAHGAWDVEPETVPLHGRESDGRAQPAEPAEPDDQSMIIVEEEYDDAQPVLARPVKPVRRQEYAQLFARLRRGE